MTVASDTTWQRALVKAREKLDLLPPIAEKPKLTAKQKQAAALKRAAYGPPGPPVDRGWLFARHPYPEYQRIMIDPETCLDLLRVMVKNRDPDPIKIRDFARQMLVGDWPFTHQAWAMDSEGRFQDGGNRAAACYLAGVPIDIPMFVGMPVDNFEFLDQGRKRTPAQVFKLEDEKNAGQLATATKLVMQIETWRGKTHLKWRQIGPANPELTRCKDRYGDPLREGVTMGYRVYNIVRECSVGSVAAAYYLIRQDNPKEVVDEWFDCLAHGSDGGTQVGKLRNKFLARRGPLGEGKYDLYIQIALILKAWELFTENDTSKRVNFSAVDQFPWQAATLKQSGRHLTVVRAG